MRANKKMAALAAYCIAERHDRVWLSDRVKVICYFKPRLSRERRENVDTLPGSSKLPGR